MFRVIDGGMGDVGDDIALLISGSVAGIEPLMAALPGLLASVLPEGTTILIGRVDLQPGESVRLAGTSHHYRLPDTTERYMP